jgi:hypothetical protein
MKLDPVKTLTLVRSAGCAAVGGGAFAAALCSILVLATWAAAWGGRPGLKVAGLEGFPVYLRPLYEDPRRISTLAFLVALTVAVAGFGLLRRRQWGRRLTLAIASLGIVWVVAAVPVSWHTAWLRAAQAPSDSLMSRMAPFLMVVNTLVGLAVIALLGFLIWALRSTHIRSQFS